MKEMVRAIFAPGLTVDAVDELIDRLLARLSRSRLKPFVRLGRTIRKHRTGILAARRLKLSNARAEALNNKAKLIVRRAYGFHSAKAALALIQGCARATLIAIQRSGACVGCLCAPARALLRAGRA
jgi:transposase